MCTRVCMCMSVHVRARVCEGLELIDGIEF